jgi:hypothetical protein
MNHRADRYHSFQDFGRALAVMAKDPTRLSTSNITTAGTGTAATTSTSIVTSIVTETIPTSSPAIANAGNSETSPDAAPTTAFLSSSLSTSLPSVALSSSTTIPGAIAMERQSPSAAITTTTVPRPLGQH